VDHYVMLFTK